MLESSEILARSFNRDSQNNTPYWEIKLMIEDRLDNKQTNTRRTKTSNYVKK